MVAWMRIKEEELVNEFVELKLDIVEVDRKIHLNHLHVSSTFKAEIQKAQQDEQELQRMLRSIGKEKQGEVIKDGEGMWRYKRRICVPNVGSLKTRVIAGGSYKRSLYSS